METSLSGLHCEVVCYSDIASVQSDTVLKLLELGIMYVCTNVIDQHFFPLFVFLKTNHFIDRRIGENNEDLSPEERLMQRFIRQKQVRMYVG